MNCKLVSLLIVFCGRRIWKRIKEPVCRAACTYTCTAETSGSAALVCGLGCREACNRRKQSETELFLEIKDQVVIPLPRDFDLYDTNKNGLIEVTELAELLSLEPTRDDVIKASLWPILMYFDELALPQEDTVYVRTPDDSPWSYD